MLELLINGISTGAVYGILAMSMSVMFYVTKVISFAQGQVMMVGVMITAESILAGAPTVVAIIAGILCAMVVSVLTYLIAIRPVLRFDRFSFSWLATTLGVALMLENAAAQIWGTTTRPFPGLLNNTTVKLAGAPITVQQILMVVVALALALAFTLVRRHTLLGKVGMAIAHDPQMASAFGANSYRFAIGTFAIAGVIAGIAGILIGPIVFANPYLGDTYGIFGFVALMLGGTRRPAMSIFSGMILGLLNQLANAVINPQAATWFPFAVVFLVLILLPSGIFSTDIRWGRRTSRSPIDPAPEATS